MQELKAAGRERARARERLVAKANQDGGSGAGRKRGTLQTIPSPRKAQVTVDDNSGSGLE